MISIIELLVNKLSFIKQKREFRLVITFSLMIFSIFFSNYLNITIPRFSNSLVGLFLLDFTNYLYNSKKLETQNLYVLICCMMLVAFAPFFGHISMNKSSITSPYFLLIVVFASFYILLFITKKMEKIKCFDSLKYIGKNSFSIMAFHFIGFKIGEIILNLFGYNGDIGLLVPVANNIFLVVYYLFFGIMFSLIISYFLKKIFKFEL